MESYEPPERPVIMERNSPANRRGVFIVVAVILALLIIGEIYSLARFSSLRAEMQSRQVKADQQLNASVSAKLQELQNQEAQSLGELRAELDSTATSMSANEKKAMRNAHYAGYLARKLQKDEAQHARQLQAALATKADQVQVANLSQDATATKSDLAQTKQNVTTLASDLGMARSKLGTLIATNHQDIAALQKLGSRDYFEFTLSHNQRKTVAGVGLTLKHTSRRGHTYNVDMFYNDVKVARKNLAIDQPVFFAPRSIHSFYEMVVYQVGPKDVKGYISTPKGAMGQEVASNHG